MAVCHSGQVCGHWVFISAGLTQGQTLRAVMTPLLHVIFPL